MEYEYKSEHKSEGYICNKKIVITKYESGIEIKVAQKEVSKNIVDSCVHAEEYVQSVSLSMKNDEAIKMRDKLIEAYPVKDDKKWTRQQWL